MRLRISIRGRVRPSVRPSVRRSVRRSVGPSVPRYFLTLKIEVFECGKSSNVINNDTMSDDEVVASYVPPRYLFSCPFFSFWFFFSFDFFNSSIKIDVVVVVDIMNVFGRFY